MEGVASLVATVERKVLILSKEGDRVLFVSPRCRVTDHGDGSLTFIDLCPGPPLWLREAQANVELIGTNG